MSTRKAGNWWFVVAALGLFAAAGGACGGGGGKGAGGAGGVAGSAGHGIAGASGDPGGLGGGSGALGQGGEAGAGAAGSAGAMGGSGGGGGFAGAGGVAGAGGGVVVDCGAGGFIGAPGSLISDGGFECPTVPAGGYTSFAMGQQFFGWTVVGAAGSVSPLSAAYAMEGYRWPAHGGSQTLDLTGAGSNSATGVSQLVPTVPGTTYHLSFWVGNMSAPGTGWGTSSTVNVMIDGTQALAAANTDGTGSTSLAWRQFTLDFVATTATTTVAFINGDPAGDNSNILDDVTIN